MAVANQTDTIYAGNKRTLKFAVTDQDTAGSPAFNLTNLIAKWTLARVGADGSVLTSAPVVEKKSTTGTQITITNAAGGLLEVYLVEVDTLTLLGDFYFELELFDVAGAHVVVATGTMTILPNVTNT